jgi:hypothetical protein
MKKLYLLFFFLCFAGLAGICLSMFHKAGLGPSDGATLFAGLLAAAIVWWQGHLIKGQMQLQAIIELEKEWNCDEMLTKRKNAWASNGKPDKEHIEGVLEFLEKVSTLEKRGVISDDLIWDTFGWYLWRYYYYSRDVIAQIRDDWSNSTDGTLYSDLERLWHKLRKREIAERNKSKRTGARNLTDEEFRAELDKTGEKFIRTERGLITRD